MVKFIARGVLSLAAIYLFGNSTMWAGGGKTWIKVEQEKGSSFIMKFGNDPDATYGIDPNLGEMEGPPLSPGFDVRWVNNPGRLKPSFGMGLLGSDFVPCPMNRARKDTFVLLVSDGMIQASKWILSWPPADSLAKAADSMYIIDTYQPKIRVDMFRQHRLIVKQPESPHRFRIYKYGGCHSIQAMRPAPIHGEKRSLLRTEHLKSGNIYTSQEVSSSACNPTPFTLRP